jgi:uncharacterized protein (DUF2252 family)
MASREIWRRISSFNQSRPLALRQRKYQEMSVSPFSFFRATCHLFHEDWPISSDLNQAPTLWVCGDLHLENFGSYKGIDAHPVREASACAERLHQRQVYFGINDFDEGNRAPLTRDIVRLVVSTLLVGKSLGLSKVDRSNLAQELIDTYRNTLELGVSNNLAEATGVVGDLLRTAKDRSRHDLLKKYIANDQTLKEITDKLLPVSPIQQDQILAVYNIWAAQQSEPAFYRCLDLKQRVAGLGSLGVDRYLLLIAGKDTESRYLLDLKEQNNSALQILNSPQWSSNAQRVLEVQSLLQSHPPDLRGELKIERKSFTIRELQPSQDKIKCTEINGSDLDHLVKTAAKVAAWSHLQGAGQQGAASRQQVVDYAANSWDAIVLEYAKSYAQQVKADLEEFVADMES